MLREQAYNAAEAVREWAEDLAKHNGETRTDLGCYCAIASAKLSDELHRKRIPHKIHMAMQGWGEAHVFCEVDGFIVDVTATQFDSEAEKIEIWPMGHDFAADDDNRWYWQPKHTYASREELLKAQKRQGWPKSQMLAEEVALVPV